MLFYTLSYCYSTETFGAPSRIRTCTEYTLNVLPLLLGYRSFWNWSSWQVTILRPSVINRELYLWATGGLKIGRADGCCPHSISRSTGECQCCLTSALFEIGIPTRGRTGYFAVKGRCYSLPLTTGTFKFTLLLYRISLNWSLPWGLHPLNTAYETVRDPYLPRAFWNWLPLLDSNQDYLSQSQVC